jgi:hypothetical protein
VITPLDSRDRSRRQLVKAGSSLTPTRNRLGLARTGTPARDSDGLSPRLESKSAKAKKATPLSAGRSRVAHRARDRDPAADRVTSQLGAIKWRVTMQTGHEPEGGGNPAADWEDHYRRPPVGVVGMDRRRARLAPSHLGPGTTYSGPYEPWDTRPTTQGQREWLGVGHIHDATSQGQ